MDYYTIEHDKKLFFIIDYKIKVTNYMQDHKYMSDSLNGGKKTIEQYL